MMRPARVLLAFLAVLSVVFFNPTQATAATSGIMSFQLGPAGLERFAADCRVSWTLNAGGMVIGSSSRCDAGPDLSPGFCQPFEGDCGSYGLVLKSSSDATCGSTAFEPYSVSGNGTVATASGLGGGYIAFDPDNCLPVQACLSYYFDPSLGGVTDEVDCITIDLDLDTGPGGSSCPAGTPHAWFSVERVNDGDPWYIDKTYLNIKVTGNSLGTARQWGAVSTVGQGMHGPISNVDTHAKIFVRDTNVYSPGGAGSLTPVPAGAGIEVYAFIPEPDGQDNYWNEAPFDYGAANPPSTFPINSESGFFGITDATQCRFYFGPKVIDDPTSDMDEPFGDAQDPEPDTSPGDPEPVVDPPEVTDPGDDFNWLQAIWALLKAILTTLGSLASAIANAILGALQALVDGILDGLEALFVPDRSIQSRMDDLDGVLDGRFPFNVADSLSSMGLAPGGGFDGRVPVGDGGSSSSGTASSGVAGGGCPSWEVIVDPSSDGAAPRNYNAVCDSSFTSAIRGARPIILAGLLAAAFWPLVRGLFFASVPVIKPVPTNNS